MKKNWMVSLLVFVLALTWSAVAFAADGGGSNSGGWAALLGVGIAAMGGGIGQGLIGSSAVGGIARNPTASEKVFTPMILSLALVESLVIFALVLAFIKG
jgi:F-type H+-transporting ATPase subunit c